MNACPTIWMFSGQGSQYYGMGACLYESEPIFRSAVEQCSDEFDRRLGISVADVIYRKRDDPYAPFTRTRETHPALFTIQYALAELLLSRDLRPDYLLGYSLGEYVAAVVSGALTRGEGIRIVAEQVRLLEQGVPPGGMLAVLGNTTRRLGQSGLFAEVDVAGINYTEHYVVSGTVETLTNIQADLDRHAVTSVFLPVEFAFHSTQLDRIGTTFQASAAESTFTAPRIPVISAASSLVVSRPSPTTLWHAARGTVEFQRTIERLEQYGPHRYLDLGPSGTLAGFVNEIVGDSSSAEGIISPFLTPERIRAGILSLK